MTEDPSFHGLEANTDPRSCPQLPDTWPFPEAPSQHAAYFFKPARERETYSSEMCYNLM